MINIKKNQQYKTPQEQSNPKNSLKAQSQEQFCNDFRNRYDERKKQVEFGGGAQSAMVDSATFSSVKTEHHGDPILVMYHGTSEFVAATQAPFRTQQYKNRMRR